MVSRIVSHVHLKSYSPTGLHMYACWQFSLGHFRGIFSVSMYIRQVRAPLYVFSRYMPFLLFAKLLVLSSSYSKDVCSHLLGKF